MNVKPSLLAHTPRSSYHQDRSARTYGEKLAKRRDQIADLWSGRHDGRLWTAQEIADEIGIQIKGVYDHIRVLRQEGDARAQPRPFPDSVTAKSPRRIVEMSE